MFSSIKTDYSDYSKSLNSRINEVNVFSIKYRYSDHLNRLFCCNHTFYCVNMISMMSASRSITSASRYHPRYQSRSSMYIRCLIPRNWLRQFRWIKRKPHKISEMSHLVNNNIVLYLQLQNILERPFRHKLIA